MTKLIIEPHYLGSLEYYTLLSQYNEVIFEVNDRFLKQTYRNRTYFLGANGIQMLTIPLVYDNYSITKDVRIDYNQKWIKDHWGAFYSAYGKAPFFEFFEDFLHGIWDKKLTFFVDLNMEMLQFLSKIVSFPKKTTFTESYIKQYDEHDFRNEITPKVSFNKRHIYNSVAYMQLFGENFTPNLSIIDLVMCCGKQSAEVLQQSIKK